MILLAAIIIIAGVIIYVLYKLCKLIPDPNGGGGGTNHISQVDYPADQMPMDMFEDGKPLVLPALTFPDMAKPEGATESNPFGFAHMELERSTNLIDWEVIMVSTNPAHILSWSDDTNMPPSQAFYRGKFVYPK
jgi:hypothetical protein